MRVQLLVAAVVFLSASTAIASDKPSDPGTPDVSPQSCIIQSLRSDMNLATAEVRSRRDLAAHQRKSAESGSPLDALSPRGKRDFLASLRFNENGLTSYRYDILDNELTVTQAYMVLALFGAEEDIKFLHQARVESPLDGDLKKVGQVSAMCGDGGGDYKDMRCADRATCAPMTRHVCKASC